MRLTERSAGRAPAASSLLAALLAACGGGGKGGSCPSGTGCPPAASDRVFALEVVPRAGQPWARQEIPHVLFDDQWVARVTLRPLVPLGGLVLDDKGAPFPALVSATRPSAIDGLPALSWATPTQADGSNDGRFVLPLGDGQYALRVVPIEGSQAILPPARFDVEVTPGAASLSLQVRVLPVPVVGRVLDPLGNGIDGYRVRVIDPDTGAAVSPVVDSAKNPGPGIVPSCKDQKDCHGSFSLALLDAVSPLSRLRLIAEAPQPDKDNPARRPDLQRDFDLDAVNQRIELDLHLPALGMYNSVEIPVLGKTGATTRGTPVLGSRVEVTADFTSGLYADERATFAQSYLVTNPEGLLAMTLFPRREMPPDMPPQRPYTVDIYPPDDSPFARASNVLTVAVDGTLGLDPLLPKPSLVGQVVAPGRGPVAGAVVSTLLAPDGPDPGRLGAPLPQAVTDSDGRFRLRVETGRYAIDVAPPAGAGGARWTFDGFDVAGDVILLTPRTLPAPVAASVRVVDPDGNAAAGVTVRLYDVTCPTGIACPAPRLRADTLTGNDGVAALQLGVAAP